MFDQVTIRVMSRAASEAFYETVLRTLEIEATYRDDEFAEWGDFSLSQATGPKSATHGMHVGFVAPSRGHVDEFWRLGRASGYEDAGPPGERPHHKQDYYGAFLLDSDKCRLTLIRVPGHAWIRELALAA